MSEAAELGWELPPVLGLVWEHPRRSALGSAAPGLALQLASRSAEFRHCQEMSRIKHSESQVISSRHWLASNSSHGNKGLFLAGVI